MGLSVGGDVRPATLIEAAAGLQAEACMLGSAFTQFQNIPFWFLASDAGGTGCITSQCSTILPSSTRNRS